MQTDFTKSKGKNQSCNVKNEIFEVFGFLLDFNVVKGKEFRSRIVIDEGCFVVSQLFCVDQFDGLSPNVVNCGRTYFVIFIVKLDAKGPYFSEVNEVAQTVQIFILHFDTFGVVVEGKVDLADGGRLLVFGCINNKMLVKWFLFDFIVVTFLIDNEVYVWLNFSDYINFIVD